MASNTEQSPRHAEINAQVISRAAQGDRAALALIYDSYVGDVYRYAYSRIGDAADAEDVTAQTFMAVIETLPRYRDRGSFSGWIFQIAYSKTMDLFRKQRRKPGDIPLDAAYSDEVLEQVVKGQMVDQLSLLLKDLDEDERELIRLRFVAGLSWVEIATVLVRKEDAVRKSLTRTLERLHRQIEVKNA